MFDKKNLQVLEFNKILEMLASFAQSEGGKEAARNLTPFLDLKSAINAQDETEEADIALYEFAINPNFAIDSISEILTKASKGAVLAIPDLMKIGRALRISKNLKKAIERLKNSPILSEMTDRLYYNDELEKGIYDAFLSETEVADNASAELKVIRQRIRKINESVRAKLQTFITAPAYSKYLQDTIVTMRGDRYVIPVKSDFKGAVAGLVHDQSSSGSTLFIEPMAVVELNNDLKVAKMNEQAEIERILRTFSSSVRGCADMLNWTYEVVVDMDLIFARAALAHAQKATRPELNDRQIIDIKLGRHPLIDQTKVVPVSLSMRENDKMLLITGPNTGGKTVTLKLVGLFVVMSMCGLYIPARASKISIFDGVYSDIGDEQSIEQSLSTFSAHIKNIIGVLDNITDKSLVLFDELGAGTDPSEGAALAVSIAEYVLNIGSKSLITSHFNDLKEFALTTNNVIAASMEFNSETFSPTYKLVMGAIGNSNALYIASRLGLSADIVAGARSKISHEKQEFDNVLNAAEETRRYAERLVGEASDDRERAASALKDVEKEKKLVVEKREKLEESIRRETKHLIDDSVDEANEILEQMRELLDKEDIVEADIFTARKLKRKLENMSAEYDVEASAVDAEDKSPLKVGNNVFVKSLGKRGVLKQISPRGEAEIAFGKLTAKVKNGDYYKVK